MTWFFRGTGVFVGLMMGLSVVLTHGGGHGPGTAVYWKALLPVAIVLTGLDHWWNIILMRGRLFEDYYGFMMVLVVVGGILQYGLLGWLCDWLVSRKTKRIARIRIH